MRLRLRERLRLRLGEGDPPSSDLRRGDPPSLQKLRREEGGGFRGVEPLHRYNHCKHCVFLGPQPLQTRYTGVTGRYILEVQDQSPEVGRERLGLGRSWPKAMCEKISWTRSGDVFPSLKTPETLVRNWGGPRPAVVGVKVSGADLRGLVCIGADWCGFAPLKTFGAETLRRWEGYEGRGGGSYPAQPVNP
jgi:hypothetical protein